MGLQKQAVVKRLLHLHPDDNVGIVLQPLTKGDRVEINGEELASPCDLAMGHKLALRAIPDGSDIVKYGAPIGIAVGTIHPGDHVHLHNIRSRYSIIEDMEETAS